MRTPLLLIVAAVALAAAGWFLLAPETSAPTNPGSSGTADEAEAAREGPARAADPGDVDAGGSTTEAFSSSPSDATASTPGIATSGDADEPEPAEPRNCLPNAYVTSRLGWPRDDARAAFVARWVTDKLVEDDNFFDQLETTPDRDKPAVMQAFNAATEKRRVALLESLGPDAAAKVVETWCTYRFDPQSLSWHRIDVNGQRVAFQHEDDDIWQNGERGDRGWDNHR